MIKNWIKLKKQELEWKLALFSFLTGLKENMGPYLELVTKLLASLQDTPAEELQDKLISAVAELAHAQAVKETK